MKFFIYLLTLCVTLISLNAHSKPKRRTVERNRSHRNTHSPPRQRKVIRVTPASGLSHQKKIPLKVPNRTSTKTIQSRHQIHLNRAERQQRRAERPQRRRVERRQTRAERPQRRRVERRQQHRVERKQRHRVERKQRRRVERRQQRRVERRQQRRVKRRQQSHRPIPSYVFNPPTRFIVAQHRQPHNNDDLYFDELYHDGERFGINEDFSDEEHRIERGLRRGLITPYEAEHLYQMLWGAYALEEACITDGYLSEEEQANLYWAERDLNRAIRWEMRDFDTW